MAEARVADDGNCWMKRKAGRSKVTTTVLNITKKFNSEGMLIKYLDTTITILSFKIDIIFFFFLWGRERDFFSRLHSRWRLVHAS